MNETVKCADSSAMERRRLLSVMRKAASGQGKLSQGRGAGVRVVWLSLLVLLLLPWSAAQASLGAVSPVTPEIMREFEILAAQLKRNPNEVPTLNSLGILYARVGQVTEAIELWKRGLLLDPRYVHLYNNLGSAYKSLKRFEEARRTFLAGLAVNRSYWVYYNLGLLERETGRLDAARAAFDACLHQFGAFEPARLQLVEMERLHPTQQASTGLRTVGALPHSPSQGEGKQPVDFAEAFKMPAPWEMQDVETGPEEQVDDYVVPGKAAPKRAIPERIYSVEDCVGIIDKIPAEPAEKIVALTFDDGPHIELTPKLLDLLKAERVPATFFVLGSRAQTYPDIVTRMGREGHVVANHTWNHRSLVKQDEKTALASLKQTATLLAGLTGQPCRLVRPPFGHTNTRVQNLIHAQGWNQIMWDVDTRDWRDGSVSGITSRFLRQFSPGAIVLFHDIHAGGLRSLPTLIQALKRCGYRFVTVDQLLGPMHAAS
jgi:peptidoglycan/xylan/chitin deacetylase (PgdA/CDA1 family)